MIEFTAKHGPQSFRRVRSDADTPTARNEIDPSQGARSSRDAGAAGRTLKEVERAHILAVLDSTSGVIAGSSGAAAVLDMHPSTLRSRMHKLGI